MVDLPPSLDEAGWCPHTTSSWSVAGITLTHRCSSKVNRSHSENALVYSFILVLQLPDRSPYKYDAFMEPGYSLHQRTAGASTTLYVSGGGRDVLRGCTSGLADSTAL